MTEAWGPETSDSTTPGPGSDVAAPPLAGYQRALERYDGGRLAEIYRALAPEDAAARPRALAAQIAERLGEPRVAGRVVSGLDHGGRMALGLFALTESAS